MLVAMPTAMPDEPLTSRFGTRVGSTDRLVLLAVVVRRRSRPSPCRCRPAARERSSPGGTRCSASPPACRRRPSRSCPGRRPACSAARSPAPCAPACRRPRCRRAGGTCRCTSPTTRAHFTYGRFQTLLRFVHREQHAPVHRLQAVAHVGQRAPDDHAHRVIEVRPAHLLFEVDGEDFARDFGHAGRRQRRANLSGEC